MWKNVTQADAAAPRLPSQRHGAQAAFLTVANRLVMFLGNRRSALLGVGNERLKTGVAPQAFQVVIARHGRGLEPPQLHCTVKVLECFLPMANNRCPASEIVPSLAKGTC